MFALPKREVLVTAKTTGIEKLARLDENVCSGDDVDDRGLAGIFPCEPYADWDVVGGSSVGNW